jgi:hypothetical protein
LQLQLVVASSFPSFVIRGEFGGGGTQRLKVRYGEDSLLS